MLALYGVVPILVDTAYTVYVDSYSRTRAALTLSCSSIDDVIFTLMFVLTVSWLVLLPDSLSYYVSFCTPHSCCHVCHLYFGLVYLFFVGVFFTFVVVEVIEEGEKDFILNFSVLIVNSLLSIVPGCVSLQSSLQGNQNV